MPAGFKVNKVGKSDYYLFPQAQGFLQNRIGMYYLLQSPSGVALAGNVPALAPVLGIDDPRTNTRISFVGGIRGTAELVKRVDSGRDAVAFSMHPVSVEQVMDIADASQIMPPKSTWFEPKLRSGLLVHTLE